MRKLNWALIAATVAGLATLIDQTIDAGGGALEIAAALLTTGSALLFGLWRDDDGDGVPNVRDVSLLLAVMLAGCGGVQSVEVDTDFGKLAFNCETPAFCVGGFCLPMPPKVARVLCNE